MAKVDIKERLLNSFISGLGAGFAAWMLFRFLPPKVTTAQQSFDEAVLDEILSLQALNSPTTSPGWNRASSGPRFLRP